MSLRDTTRALKIIMGVMLGLFIAGGAYMQWQARKLANQRIRATQGEDGTTRQTATSSRFEEARRLVFTQPEEAIKRLEPILAQPASTDERDQARGAHADALEYLFYARVKAGRLDEANAVRARLAAAYPDSNPRRRADQSWKRELERQFAAAIQTKNRPAAEAALRLVWAEPPDDGNAEIIRSWHNTQLDTFAVTAKQRGASALPEAAGIAALIASPATIDQLAYRLAESGASARALAEQADGVARTGAGHAAIAYLTAAVQVLESRRRWDGRQDLAPAQWEKQLAELRGRTGMAWIQLGDRLSRGERIDYVTMNAIAVYRAAAESARSGPVQANALGRALRHTATVLAADAREFQSQPLAYYAELPPAAAQEFHGGPVGVVDALIRNNRQTLREFGLRLWENRLGDLTFNPWPLVPAELTAAIDRALPGKPTEKQRRDRLAVLYRERSDAVPLAELDPLRGEIHRLAARWALAAFDRSPAQAVEDWRSILRFSPDAALRLNLAAALRLKLAGVRRSGDFAAYYVLAGFYAAEVGVPAAGDPFREEFKQGLAGGAAQFRENGQTMKQLFMLGLLSQYFFDEPEGRAAREEVFPLAAAQVVSVPTESRPQSLPSSGAPDWSIDRLNNGTEFHLMSFYLGPVKTLVFCWPYRRGTVVLPNGDYEIVVVSPEQRIKPYRGTVTLRGQARTADYVLQGDRRTAAQNLYGEEARGSYTLLHAPPGAAGLAIDPRTGLLKPKR